jgi:MerR family transcriptional regulator, thiopeptide resistance regulator
MMADTPSSSCVIAAPPWRVGVLARETGLTVRTLHHYDAIGLLVPSQRTPGAHRLYSSDDIARLQQIQSLRSMRMPIADIARLLATPFDKASARSSASDVIRAHREHLRATIAAQTALLHQLDQIAERLAGIGQPSVAQLCTLIRQAHDTQRVERFFTATQLASLAQVRASSGHESGMAVMQQWQDLIGKVDVAMRDGDAPDAPEVQALARQWRALLSLSVGGEPDTADAARAMYERDGDALSCIMPLRPTRAMFAYLEQASRSAPPRANEAVDP